MLRLPLTADTVGSVARGHPWVYSSGLAGPAGRAGELAQLLDDRGRVVGFGLCDEGPIAVRLLGRHPEPMAALLRRRLGEALALRQATLPAETTAWRLCNGEGDALPGVVVDHYAGVAILKLYSRSWEPHLEELVAVLADLGAGIGLRSVLRRRGVRAVDGGDHGSELLWGEAVPERLVVREHGLSFVVRPHVGQKTGLFLDQREHRRIIGGLARDREVVNLFSYTGGFSVYAAAGGARRVISVDVASPALEDARENFRLNGLDPDRHGFEAADVFQWSPSARPGLLICDPPSLSHEKDSDGAARKAYAELAAANGRLLEPGGLYAPASCTARLSGERWEQAVREGLRRAGRWSWLWRSGESVDHPVNSEHPEGRYLKFAVLVRR
jgi:23S rRNA (cytosine1962-C5)-methyltransferase